MKKYKIELDQEDCEIDFKTIKNVTSVEVIKGKLIINLEVRD